LKDAMVHGKGILGPPKAIEGTIIKVNEKFTVTKYRSAIRVI